MIVEYLEEFGEAKRADIENLIVPKLSELLTLVQRRDKVKNLLQALRREGSIFLKGRKWYVNPED